MNTGLPPKTIQALESVFKQFDAIDKVVLYGSRALGTHRPGSDIDLALFGSEVTPDLIASIAILIDDLLLPYTSISLPMPTLTMMLYVSMLIA